MGAENTIEIRIVGKNEAGDTLAEVNGQLVVFKKEGDKASGSARELEAKLNLAKQAFSAITSQIMGAVEETINYSNSAQDAARMLGVSVQEASALINVADDVRVSVGELTVAFRNAAKDGITPNIETLIQLSDQYRAIQDPAERLNFVMDAFGPRGAAMARILELDAEQIRAMASEASAAGLILDDAMVAKSEGARMALDSFNDATLGLKIAFVDLVGGGFAAFIEGAAALVRVTSEGVSWLANLVGQINATGLSTKDLYAATWEVIYTDRTWIDVINEANDSEANRLYLLPQVATATTAVTAAVREYASIQLTAVNGTEEMSAAMEDWAAKQELVRGNTEHWNSKLEELNDYIGGTLGPTIDDFNVKQGELAGQMVVVQGKIAELESRAYLTAEQQGQLDDLRGEYDDLSKKYDENAAAHEDATARILFGILQQKIAMGDFGEAGVKLLETVAENWGLTDDATVQATLAAGNIVGLLQSGDMQGAINAVYDLGESFGVTADDAGGAADAVSTSGAEMALALEPPATRVQSIVSGLGMIDGMSVEATVTITENGDIDKYVPSSPPPLAQGFMMVADAALEMQSAFDRVRGFDIDLSGIEDVMGFAGGLSGVAGGLIGQFTKRTLDPMQDRLEGITQTTDDLFSLFEDQGFDSMQQLRDAVGMFGDTVVPAELRDELQQLLLADEQRAVLAEEYAKQQQIVLDLQKQQQELDLLEQQMKLFDLITQYGLDPSEILGGLELGQNADIGAILEALTRAMEQIVSGLAEGFGAYNLSIYTSASAESALSDFAMMRSLAGVP